MSEKMQDKLIEYVEMLAQQMGVAAEYVMTMLIRQKYVEGIVYAILNGVLLIFGIVLVCATFKWSSKLLFKHRNREHEQRYDDTYIVGFWLVAVIGSIISIILLIMSTVNVAGYTLVFANPDYYAIQEILKAFRGSSE